MLTKTQTAGKTLLLDVHQRLNAAMRACIAWAAVEEHDKILDMACGDGQMLCRLNDQLRLTLCGMCETADQARSVSELLGGADVIPGRMEDIPWRDGTFDAVLLSAPMKGEPARVLGETMRVLRPGGQFVMAAPLLRHRWEGEGSRREMMRLMQEAGFREVSFRATGLSGAIVGWKPGIMERQKSQDRF
jgi:ubiquinone/menaquinone biosynthesis C-methylase UbiE